MDQISQKEFDDAAAIAPDPIKPKTEIVSEKKFEAMLVEMQKPVMAQKRIAVQIKNFLDKQIDSEMADKGYLSENTRKWVDSYNKILENLQKALYGDKTTNLHLHKVSHSEIATKMREAVQT